MKAEIYSLLRVSPIGCFLNPDSHLLDLLLIPTSP
jgi:hypothetical protein